MKNRSRFMQISGMVMFLILSMIGMACSRHSSASSSGYYLFVGTYTNESSDGIYLYKFNTDDGSVDSLGETAGVANPSYLALSPDHSHLYAVNEMADSARATVSSFSFDKQKGTLKFINKQPTLGGAPCYVSVDAKGKTVFVANYAGGSLSAFPVNDDGSLQKASTHIEHHGGSVNKNRQASPHVHCTFISPDNNTLFVDDLGTDKVYGYHFHAQKGNLEKDPFFTFKGKDGAGPRHLTFHPNGNFAYLVNEINGSVVAFKTAGDSLQAIQTISGTPEKYEGAISGADIHVSPDGNFLYASNREDLNDIVIYAINQKNGKLTKVGKHSSGGMHPRNFTIDPTGKYLLAANKNSNNIVVFKRDKENGTLTPTGTELKVSQPVCLKMIRVE